MPVEHQLEEYVVEAEIGHGSFATVYRGHHRVHCRLGPLF